MTETNPLRCNLENECRTTQFGSFGFWSFDIVSDFVFRASNFRFYGEASHTLLWGASSKPFALGGDYLLLPSVDTSKPTLEVSTMLFATHNVKDLNQHLVSPAFDLLKGFGADHIHFIDSPYNRFGC